MKRTADLLSFPDKKLLHELVSYWCVVRRNVTNFLSLLLISASISSLGIFFHLDWICSFSRVFICWILLCFMLPLNVYNTNSGPKTTDFKLIISDTLETDFKSVKMAQSFRIIIIPSFFVKRNSMIYFKPVDKFQHFVSYQSKVFKPLS